MTMIILVLGSQPLPLLPEHSLQALSHPSQQGELSLALSLRRGRWGLGGVQMWRLQCNAGSVQVQVQVCVHLAQVPAAVVLQSSLVRLPRSPAGPVYQYLSCQAGVEFAVQV